MENISTSKALPNGNVGPCKNCGSHTASGSFDLCHPCAEKLHQCAHCHAHLTTRQNKAGLILPKSLGQYTLHIAMTATAILLLLTNVASIWLQLNVALWITVMLIDTGEIAVRIYKTRRRS